MFSTDQGVKSELVQAPTYSWGLDRVDQMTGGLTLNNAYSYKRDGTNVDVYIIDTGIFIENTDFGGRARLGADFTGEGNFDGNGHGSHVAGALPPIVIVYIFFSLLVTMCVPCSLFLAT